MCVSDATSIQLSTSIVYVYDLYEFLPFLQDSDSNSQSVIQHPRSREQLQTNFDPTNGKDVRPRFPIMAKKSSCIIFYAEPDSNKLFKLIKSYFWYAHFSFLFYKSRCRSMNTSPRTPHPPRLTMRKEITRERYSCKTMCLFFFGQR